MLPGVLLGWRSYHLVVFFAEGECPQGSRGAGLRYGLSAVWTRAVTGFPILDYTTVK
jgi:hypothetical protein